MYVHALQWVVYYVCNKLGNFSVCIILSVWNTKCQIRFCRKFDIESEKIVLSDFIMLSVICEAEGY